LSQRAAKLAKDMSQSLKIGLKLAKLDTGEKVYAEI
jgi:hypothetical protein